MIRIRQDVRRFESQLSAVGFQAQAIDLGIEPSGEKARGARSSLVDPEADRHAGAVLDRPPGIRVAIRSRGAIVVARLLERRLAVDPGEVETLDVSPGAASPKVHLAHAPEDEPPVRPVAENPMMPRVEVWFDEWDRDARVCPRREMEQESGRMAHFVTLIPIPTSKPWGARSDEIGATRPVGSASRRAQLRVGVELAELPPMLQTLLRPHFEPTSDVDDLDTEPFAAEPGWTPRRTNGAVGCRKTAIDARHSRVSLSWRAVDASLIDPTLPSARSHA